MLLTKGRFYDTIGSPEPFCATRQPDDAMGVSFISVLNLEFLPDCQSLCQSNQVM